MTKTKLWTLAYIIKRSYKSFIRQYPNVLESHWRIISTQQENLTSKMNDSYQGLIIHLGKGHMSPVDYISPENPWFPDKCILSKQYLVEVSAILGALHSNRQHPLLG
jgi:hypothetical protein